MADEERDADGVEPGAGNGRQSGRDRAADNSRARKGKTPDMRIEQLTARRQSIGCLWLFLAVPGLLGVFLLLNSGFTSGVGWVLTVLYVLATGYLGYLYLKANIMPLAEPRGGESGRWGIPKNL